MAVRSGNGKLSSCRGKSGQEQESKLSHGWQDKDRQHQWNGCKAGKDGEEQYDHGAFDTVLAGDPHKGIGKACPHAADRADQRWKGQEAGQTGLDDQQRADESQHEAKELCRTDVFFEQEIRKDHCEKR